MDAFNRFATWLAITGWSPIEQSYYLGVDRSHLSRVARGERLPGRRLANVIERLSADWAEGPIRSVEWDAVEDAKSGAAA